jgi:hypothetical protein
MNVDRAREHVVPLVRPLTYAFLLLTACAVAGPVTLLAVPGLATTGGALALASAVSVLIVIQVAGLVVVGLCLAGRSRPRRFLFLLAAADLLAVGNAVRLLLRVRWGGLGPELLEAVWFCAPLALWGLAVWSDVRTVTSWWASPLRWIVLGLPIVFLLAALSRIDFRYHTGAAAPTPVAWLLVYAPTILVLGLALGGWLAFEEARLGSLSRLAPAAATALLPGAALGFLAASVPTASFVLSNTVTWGTGYQMFVAGPRFAPLGLSLALLGMAVAAYVGVLVRLRREGRPAVGLLLALAAVLSGILSMPVSVLGSLLALQLLWTTIIPAAARP